MVDAPRANPFAEATGFRSRASQAASSAVGRTRVLHRNVCCPRYVETLAAWTALNSTPRLARGIPYPLISDSVRCHA
ncbi:hypothetical protein CI15_18560 [Paraburkholderia monticola]|jgi:hypothetical protein|uniref:Uncharacterized protein n=1 Tax=Paraburkholderia monticola TaxID=1399968 RepID=A0A149PN89_9BURK|nr:hypothetical protein CI15_18560 [Paraburkholderia monticola]